MKEKNKKENERKVQNVLFLNRQKTFALLQGFGLKHAPIASNNEYALLTHATFPPTRPVSIFLIC